MTAPPLLSRLLCVSSSVLFAASVACSNTEPNAGRAQSPAHAQANCTEFPLPVSTEDVSLANAGCRLAATALIALVSDSNAAAALAGSPVRPAEFLVRRAPYLPVGANGPATEQVVVTIRLLGNRWDADVWFTDSLKPLAVFLSHKPM